jgi:hypothetical protein
MSICIDTNVPERWNPFRVLAFGGIGLVLLAAAVLALIGACTGGGPPQSPTGTVSLAWSIFDATTQPATCDQVSARSVALRLRPRTGGDAIAVAMPCAPGSGTAQVAPGTYDIAIELHAADGTRLAGAQEQAGITINAGRTTTLTAARFAANMTFRLVASIATSARTNCQATTSGGAGMTGNSVTLERTDPGREGCAAVTFSRAQGDAQEGTYTVNCGIPAFTTCIEKNETLTASVPPGTYLIHVRGKRGLFDCWRGDDKLTVAPSSLPTRHSVTLMHFDQPPC